MAKVKLPAYVKPKPLASGKTGYFWVRPSWADPKLATSDDEQKRRMAVRNGKTCPIQSTALGTELAHAITKAEAINEAFKEWREGREPTAAVGTIKWLFAWYREQDKFTGNAFLTRKGYRVAMDMVEAIEMKNGIFGDRQAKVIDATAADTLYKKARTKHGERQGSYMMQVCRLVWNHAARHHKTTGVKDKPFSAMGIKSSSGAGKGNRAATRAEYNLYRETARAMGRQSMATAAALCFEGCQRVYDAFGFKDPDGRITRGIRWDGYQPSTKLTLIQSKTGNEVDIPLVDKLDGELVDLYPELEEELARMERRADGGLIVRDERTGEQYTTDYMQYLHGKIRKKAGLPKDLRFTSFRHGGLTEIGDAGEDDVRAISGHSTLDVTRIYNKASQVKAKRIATRRREHITMLEAAAEAANEAANNQPEVVE